MIYKHPTVKLTRQREVSEIAGPMGEAISTWKFAP